MSGLVLNENITAINRGKHLQQTIKKNRPPAPGPGRQKGYRTPATIRKIAVKLLQETLLDEGAPIALRVQAACKLVDEFKV